MSTGDDRIQKRIQEVTLQRVVELCDQLSWQLTSHDFDRATAPAFLRELADQLRYQAQRLDVQRP